MEIAIFIFLTFFLILTIKRIDLALFVLVTLLPSYLIRFQFLGIPLTLLESMIVIIFAVWFYRERFNLKKKLSSKEKITPYPFYKEIILLLIISFSSLIVADFSVAALGIWKAYFFEPILLFIVAVNILRNNKNRQKIFFALGISVLSVSLLAIYQKISGQLITNDFWAAAETRRVVSWFGYPNAVGLFLAPLVAFFLGVFYSLPVLSKFSRALKKMFFLALIFLGLSSIYFARSDGGLIAFLIATFTFYFLADKKKRIISICLASIFIITAVLYQPLGETVKNRLGFQDLSGQIRLQQWQETLQALKGKAFVLGNGLSGYQTSVKPYHQEGIFFNYDGLDNFDAVVWASSTLREKYWQPVEIYLYPHNFFLNFWTELGFFGALLFIWLVFKAMFIALKGFYHLSKENNRDRYLFLGILVAFLAILIHGLVDVPYFKNDLSAIFFLLLAILASLKLELENKK